MPSHTFRPSTFTKFDRMATYIETSLLVPDPDLQRCLEQNSPSDLDAIDIPTKGSSFIFWRKCVVRKGWLAKALPKDGQVISLEISPEHARVARSNISHAKLSDKIEIRVGTALETLAKMKENREEKFDMVFIDADKENNKGYLEFALELGKRGTVVVVDNVVRQGKVLSDRDAASEGVRKAMEFLKGERRFEATALQTVGPKGWDGMVVARIVD